MTNNENNFPVWDNEDCYFIIRLDGEDNKLSSHTREIQININWLEEDDRDDRQTYFSIIFTDTTQDEILIEEDYDTYNEMLEGLANGYEKYPKFLTINSEDSFQTLVTFMKLLSEQYPKEIKDTKAELDDVVCGDRLYDIVRGKGVVLGISEYSRRGSSGKMYHLEFNTKIPLHEYHGYYDQYGTVFNGCNIGFSPSLFKHEKYLEVLKITNPAAHQLMTTTKKVIS
jgi:hypothetical protein